MTTQYRRITIPAIEQRKHRRIVRAQKAAYRKDRIDLHMQNGMTRSAARRQAQIDLR